MDSRNHKLSDESLRTVLDVRRLADMLSRIKGRIVHKALDHVSSLAVPVMLEIDARPVYGEAADSLLAPPLAGR